MIDVNRYIGAPFAEKGRGPAYDCWGLVHAIYREQLGIDVPSYDDRYFRTLDKNIPGILTAESKKWTRVRWAQPGDVVLFRIKGRVRHVGIVTAPGRMIHTLAGCETCIERYDTPLWRPRIDGFYRYNTDHR